MLHVAGRHPHSIFTSSFTGEHGAAEARGQETQLIDKPSQASVRGEEYLPTLQPSSRAAT